MSLYDIGDQLYFEGRYQEAADIFRECIDKQLELNSSINYLGCCELQLGNFEQALGWFDEVIGRAPHWERPHINKSRVLIKQGNLIEAKKCLDDALQINSEHEDVYYYLGIYYEKCDDLLKSRGSI